MKKKTILIITLLISITFLIPKISVNATTGSITSYNWRARYYSFPPPGSGDYGLGDWCSFINGHTPCWPGENDTGYVAGFAFRGYYSGGYKAGNSYTFRYTMNTSSKTEILNNLGDINSNISNRRVALANGQYEGFTFYDDITPSIRFENSSTANELYVYISFISDIDFKSFAVAFDFNNGLYFGSVDWISVYSVSVTYSEGVGAQIDNQTNIMNENQQTIINNINNTNDILNQDHTYNNDPNRDTTTQNNQLTSYEQEEQQLLNNLNLNIEDAEVSINGNASSFIWEIINRIRQTSGKIVLLFTSVLSLGIIKLILGR